MLNLCNGNVKARAVPSNNGLRVLRKLTFS